MQTPLSNNKSNIQTGSNETHLKRKLKTRHLSMIAIGGTIETGLFLASVSIINTAGPGGAAIAYLIAGIILYFLMTS
ncbi:lysine-specific permease LysP [Priestia filamentosa]|nr:lysine-specific permease LysP [Priestia filamentosa]